MLLFIIPGVILLILIFTAHKALTCSHESETLTCNIWRVTHVLTALYALWQVVTKFQTLRAVVNIKLAELKTRSAALKARTTSLKP